MGEERKRPRYPRSPSPIRRGPLFDFRKRSPAYAMMTIASPEDEGQQLKKPRPTARFDRDDEHLSLSDDKEETDPPSLAMVSPSQEVSSMSRPQEEQVHQDVARRENTSSEYTLFDDGDSTECPAPSPLENQVLKDDPVHPGQDLEPLDSSFIERIDLEVQEGEAELASVLQQIYNSDENFRKAITPIFLRFKNVDLSVPLKSLDIKDPPRSGNVNEKVEGDDSDEDIPVDHRKPPARENAQ